LAVLTTILSPDPTALSAYGRVVDSLAKRLLPPGHDSEKHIQVSEERGLLVAVLGRRDHVVTRGYNILAGVTLTAGEQAPWWRFDDPVPDGSFALFRTEDFAIESVTDYTGSKTIWHARLACGGVVTSTCVELIVALLGDFSVDDRALGWFLSSGTCGPRRSWDKRIKPVPPNSRLSARKEGSTIEVREMPLERPQPRHEHVDAARLESELHRTMSNSCFGDKPWVLALSGGYDSRAILYGTRHIQDLTCVTWADEFLVDQPNSDLAIARLLAEKTGRKHLVKVIKRPADAAMLDQALRRFMRYCDGRVDNYLAYVDGMQIWDELSSSEAGGLLRGDELFGTAFALRAPQILKNMRLISFVDYARGDEQSDLAIRHDHTTPADLSKRPGESAASWRWRLRADHEIPTVYAALNSIRGRFTEVSCPLLAGNLVRLAASMSSKDLDDKALFNQVVSGMFPDVPFASRLSILRRSDVLAIPEATELVLDHLGSAFARDVLGVECAQRVSEELTKLDNNKSIKSDNHGIAVTKKSSTPAWAKQIKRRFDSPPPLDLPALGMRSFLANVIQEEMTDTAKLGAQARNRSKHETA
jgi:hypothetical protein